MLKVLKSSLVILGMTFILGGGNYIYAEDNLVTAEQKKQIQDTYQFSDDMINDFSNEDLKEYLIDIDHVKVQKKEQYFKIQNADNSQGFSANTIQDSKVSQQQITEVSKEEAYAASSAPSINIMSSCGISNGYDCYSEANFVKLETWITKTSSSGGKVSARFEWLKIRPLYQDKDVFAIGLNSNFSPVPGTEKGFLKKELWDTPAGAWKTITTNYTTATKRDAGGYGYNMDLGNSGRNHRGYMEFQYKKNVTNVTLADAFAHYAHQEKTLSVSPAFSIPLGGSLSLSSATSYSIMQGHAQYKPW